MGVMRVLLAALFVLGSSFGSMGLLHSRYGDHGWPWWTKAVPGVVMVGSMFAALFVFNSSGYRPSLRRKSMAQHIADLEVGGKLLRQPFKAMRAFALEEFEDEGPHYYIELADNRVLYLNGQYLYEYEAITDDPEFNQVRRFPCTEFTVLRHKDAGYVLQVECSGTVIEPELTAPSFTRADFRQGIPDDGDVISDRSYESLKRERSSARPA